MNWMFLPLKRFADFNGRSPRIEYWMFMLLKWSVILVLGVLGFAMIDSQGTEPGAAFSIPIGFAGLLWLVLWLPTLAVTVRRLHDRGMSGWFYLVSFIPLYIGMLIIFIFMVMPGNDGENEYGENPLDEAANRAEDLEQVFT